MKYTLAIPSIKVESLEFFIQWLYYEDPGPDGTFHMYGPGDILNDELEVIGAASFMNSGRYVTPPPIVEWFTDGTVVGTIWAGPYAGMVLNVNADIHAMVNVVTGEGLLYDSALVGFFLVTDNVDRDALKALKKRGHRK